jgi:hypothetical protein
MTCVSPPELDDGDFLTYVDGEADHRVVAHLEQCPHCREKARRLARFQGRLTSQLYRITCPSPLELGEYHLGMLSTAQAEAVAEHLASCPHCVREIAQLEGYLAELEPSLEPDLLKQVKRRVRVLIASRLIRDNSEGDWPRQPALTPAYAGVRGDEGELFIYQADDIQVVIEIQDDVERPGRKTILGLVVGLGDDQDMEAHLWQAGQRVTVEPVDELGNFVIPDLIPASYELILVSSEKEIHVQDLQVGSSQDET